MSWQEISDKDAWNSFLLSQKNNNFLQSFEFGEFYLSLGKKIWRLGFGSKKIDGICLLVKQESKFGNFIYVPGGPFLDDINLLDSLITTITQIAKVENISFVRFDPRIVSQSLDAKFSSLGLKKIKNFTQPQCTQVLDLTKSLEDLKRSFSESTRYNVGWVARKGVRVEFSSDEKDFTHFEKLLQETSQRQNFRLHGEVGYYQKQFKAFLDAGKASLYIAREPSGDGNTVLAAAVIITFGKTVTYLHAASSSKNPKLRAPYLMQWQIIEDAKKAGAEFYDFWGVSASDSKTDPWAGVTGFKKGFGGEKICYDPPYDLVLDKKYWFFSLSERLRKQVQRWL